MNWFTRWWGRLKAPQVMAPEFLRTGISPFGTELPGLLLPDAQAELYQRLSWVYIATTLVAQTAAGTPFQVKRRVGEKTEQIENHPFELLLQQPNPLQSQQEFLEAVIGFRTLTGNAYIWQNKSAPTAAPSELWVIPTQQIEPIPDERLYIRGYAYDPGDGRKLPLEPWEICHFKRFHSRNRFVGLSPIEALAVTAESDLAMARWNANFFDKDHAKPAGALAFADPINDSDWETVKRDAREQHGGTERRLMMMRNAGKGGVQWLQFGVNQKDMEFLAARTFNKEEIFAAIAPGLSSMLAVNATEANSVAGKATFSEFTLWPIHQALAQKISKDILPAYGQGLLGEFEDVRIADRTMDLQEQQTAFRVLTIQEARERYYQLGPLGDERDVRLVADATTPPPVASAPVERVTPEPPAEVEPVAPVDEADDQEDTTLRAELLRWQRKAWKRVKAGQGAACEFESEAIPEALGAAIQGALEAAQDRADITGIFDNALAWGVYP